MARVIENEDLYEAWKNESAGIVVIKRVARTGELTDELLTAGKVIHLTPSERRMNQETFADPGYDFFTNGTLSPVKLVETAEDVEQFKGNPNHLSEDEMRGFFKSKAIKAFESRVEGITNPIALNKLLAIATEEDATLRQVQVIKGRLEEVAPSLYSSIETISGPNL